MSIDLVLTTTEKKHQIPVVGDEITWELSRKNEPGKLTFKVVADSLLSMEEGNNVQLVVDKQNLFTGYVFTMKRDKNQIIDITCYDQLRYMKNKDLYVYTNKKANELLQMITSDFGLHTGTIEDTGYIIPQRREDNQTLFDIVQYALDETVRNTNQLFVLYDDFGNITLKNIANMKSKTLIDADTASDYDYSSSIDSTTYNYIKLVYESKKEGQRLTPFIAKDTKTQEKWGILQYFGKVQTDIGGQERANEMLKLYNRVSRTLTVKNALGDYAVRAGSLVPISLNLGDMKVESYLVAEKVIHHIKHGIHTMDLKLSGGDGFVS